MSRLDASRRAEIVRDALARFIRSSYDATSMRDLSRALGMTQGNLYNYFHDKADLLFACHGRALDELDALVARLDPATPPGRRLEALLAGLLEVIGTRFGGTALALEIDALSEEQRRLVVNRRERFERVVRAVLQEGIESGEFRPLDPKLAAFALLGAVNWTARWWRPEGGLPLDGVARAFTDLFLRGLAAAPRPEPGSGGPARPASLPAPTRE